MVSRSAAAPGVPHRASQRVGDTIDAMSRRTSSLVVSGVVLVALVTVAFSVPMPYVLESPGVTENTLGEVGGKPVIQITGAKTYPVDGHLELTTVSVSRAEYQARLPDVLSAWIASDQIVLPRDVVYPPDKSTEQVEQENAADMLDSQSTAIVAGLMRAGINPYVVEVQDVESGGPADGRLSPKDQIVAVNGEQVASSDVVVKAISALPPSSKVKLQVRRGDDLVSVTVTTEQNPDEASKSRIGVSLADVFDPPVDVKIKLDQDIGGPSAGLVFSLAIYDLLTPGPLTGGRFVAGTGTIDAEGKVGPIGGIQQKIIGAYKGGHGASVFLVPADNCEEAAASDLKDTVLLVEVATLDDAVSALESIDAGDDASLTLCGR